MTDIPASASLHSGPRGDSRPPFLSDPVVLPSATNESMTDHICAIALRDRPYLWWWIAIAPAIALTGVLAVAIVWLFYAGVGIWGVDWPVAWGFALVSYVWWIGIASGLWASAEDLRKYRDDYKVHIPLTLDESGALFRAFRVTDVPTILIADAQGRLARRMVPDNPEGLRKAIDGL